MTFDKTVTLKDGRSCLLRNGVVDDGQASLNMEETRRLFA